MRISLASFENKSNSKLVLVMPDGKIASNLEDSSQYCVKKFYTNPNRGYIVVHIDRAKVGKR